MTSLLSGEIKTELTVGEFLSYHKNEVGVICKYVTLHDLFQSQVNQQVQILDEKTKELSLLNHAEEFAKQGAAGAKKLGTAAKQQLLKPVDKLTGDRNNTIVRENSIIDSQLDSSRLRDKPLKSEVGRSLNENSNDARTEFDMSAGGNTEVIRIGSDSNILDRQSQSQINEDLSTPLLQDIDVVENDDLELNLSATLMNKSNEGQNSGFRDRLKKIVLEGPKVNK